MTTQPEDPLVPATYVKDAFAPDCRPSNMAIWRWINNGGLPRPDTKIGKRHFWRRSRLDAALSNLTRHRA